MNFKQILIFIVFLLPSIYGHANINIELQDAKIPDVVQLFMKQIFKAEYILAPEIKADTRSTTVSLKNKTPDQAKQVFQALMTEYDIALENRQGIVFVKKSSTNKQTTQQTTTLIPQVRQDLPPLPIAQTTTQAPNIEKIEFDQTPTITDLIESENDADTLVYEPKYISPASLQNILKFTRIESHIAHGKIVFNVPADRRDFISNLISDFDKQRQDVVIKASLYEYSKRHTQQNAIEAVFNILKNTLAISIPSINIASATRLTLTAADVSATFRALNQHENFKVLSSPTIRATDEKTSSINIGASVPVLNQIVTAANGNTQQSVVYRDSGITLSVTPRIRADNIELDLLQNVSDFTQTTTGVNNSPTLIQRRLETTLNCKDGDLILLGGLEQQRNENGKSSFFSLTTSNRKLTEDTDLLLVLHVTKI